MSTRKISASRVSTLWLSMPRLPRSTWDSHDSDPSHQPGEDGLGQAAPPPGLRDPLACRLPDKWLHRVMVLSGSAATTSRQGGSRRSYGASGSNSTLDAHPAQPS